MRGAFVVLVGPDGVGKTSVASALVRDGARYFHFRPPFTRPWMPPAPGETIPKQSASASTLSSVGRLLANVGRFWIGYLARVAPERWSGRMVVGDRWAYGYVAKPAELRYFGPAWLARAAVAAMPHPDVVVCLTAPVDVIRSRKAELSPDEIAADLRAWTSVPARRLIEVDATRSPDEIARQIRAALRRRSAAGSP